MLITLSLYILRELGKALGLALLVFSFFLLILTVGQIVRGGASLLTIFKIIPMMFPLISPMVLPLTIVTGTLICYGRLSSNNEYVAAQASGIHPGWFVSPALAAAVLASIITVFLNADVLTMAVDNIEETLVADKTGILRKRLSKPGSFTLENWTISRLPRSWDKEGRAGIVVTDYHKPKDEDDDGDGMWSSQYPYPSNRHLARNHSLELTGDPETKKMVVKIDILKALRMVWKGKNLELFSGGIGALHKEIQDKDTEIGVTGERITYWGITKLGQKLDEVDAEIAVETEKYNELRALDENAARHQYNSIEGLWESRHKRVAELHLKLALSFSCIGFAVIGIPLGLRMRRQNRSVGFAIGFSIAVCYYVVIKGMQGFVKDGHVGGWIIWLPNLALLIVGAFLWISSQRRN